MLTETMLAVLWPRAAEDLAAGIVQSAATVFSGNGLSTPVAVAHAMAQFSHECGAGTVLVENLNYSAARLQAVWPARFDAAKAAAFARQPQKIANEVYNGRMGNRPGSDDGWTFRGRGAIQLTGRENYTKLGQKTGLDLLANPDLVNEPDHFLPCAVGQFLLCGCLPFAQQDDVRGVTYHLNGGYNGLAERQSWLGRWKAALAGSAPQPHGTAWLQGQLNRLGHAPPLQVDGDFGPATLVALKAFQAAHGLTVDGRLGPQTIAALEAA